MRLLSETDRHTLRTMGLVLAALSAVIIGLFVAAGAFG